MGVDTRRTNQSTADQPIKNGLADQSTDQPIIDMPADQPIPDDISELEICEDSVACCEDSVAKKKDVHKMSYL